MKKFKILAVLLTALLLCGCGSRAEPKEQKRIVIGFSQLGAESDWRVANTDSMQRALSSRNGYELIYDNAMQKQANQLAAVRSFVLQGVDIIVIAPVAETGWDAVLQEARNANIPVIIVDREVSVEDDSLYLTGIGSDFLKEGRQAVAWLEDTLIHQGRAGEEIQILHIQGTDGATSQLMRTKALDDAVRKYRNWNICGKLSGDYTEVKSYEMVRDFLKTNRDIDVIYSENDNMTFGAMRALDEAGITYGENGDVMLISFDAVRQALEYCMEGKINLCVECNPLHGPRVDELIHQYLLDEEIPKQIYVEETVFTPESLSRDVIDSRSY